MLILALLEFAIALPLALQDIHPAMPFVAWLAGAFFVYVGVVELRAFLRGKQDG